MTDLELALLFSEYLNAANFIFSNFMAPVFAYLGSLGFFFILRRRRMERPDSAVTAP